MRNTLNLRRIWITLVMILAVSTAGLGFAHKAPSDKDQALAVFALLGASTADVCGGDNGDGLPDDPCPACRLVDSLLLPVQSAATLPADQRLLPRIVAPMESHHAPRVFDPIRASRAPPIV